MALREELAVVSFTPRALVLEGSDGYLYPPPSDTLTFLDVAYAEIEPCMALKSGFLFARDGQWVAAAEWTPPGSLRLGSGLDPEDRGLIAAASSALLLYDTLSSPALRK